MANIKKLSERPTIINTAEFEGLAAFEEIHSLKIMKEVKRFGRKSVSCQIYKDKRKNYERKKLKTSHSSESEPQETYFTSNYSWCQDNSDTKKMIDTSVKGKCNANKKQKFNICESDWKSIFTPDEVIEAIKELGFQRPTEIQKLTIPAAIIRRRDIIGAAETGSGKTLAFAIPVINGILNMHRQNSQNLKQEYLDNKNFADEHGDIYCVDGENEGESRSVDGENGQVDIDSVDGENEDDIDIVDGENEQDDIDSVDGENEKCEMKLGCVKVIDNIDCPFFPTIKKQVTSIDKKPLIALFITPTRELAIQIKKHVDAILTRTTIKAAVIIGGLSYAKQERVLNDHPEIVIGTPGRLWEMIQHGNEHLSDLSGIRYLVIDETDRMLEKGHFEELTQLLTLVNEDSEAKKKRQTFIFSATLTLKVAPPKRLNSKKKVRDVTSEMKLENLIKLIGIRDKPKIVDITRTTGTATMLSEAKINCDKEEKDVYLYYLIKKFPGRTLVFCNSINCVKRLSNLLTLLQCKPQALHASKQQKQRLRSLEQFATDNQSILLATDVAARGIDISGIDHVIHYEFPRTAEIYIHRSGRTARANQEGISILLIDYKELEQYKSLCVNLSHSKEIPSLPLDESFLMKVKERVHLAQLIETAEHAVKRKQTDKSWYEQMAEEADIIWNDNGEYCDDDDAAEDLHEKKKKSLELSRQKTQLKQLLNKPIMQASFNFRYPSATVTKSITASNIETSAIDLLKDRKKVKKSKDISVPTRICRKKNKTKKALNK